MLPKIEYTVWDQGKEYPKDAREVNIKTLWLRENATINEIIEHCGKHYYWQSPNYSDTTFSLEVFLNGKSIGVYHLECSAVPQISIMGKE